DSPVGQPQGGRAATQPASNVEHGVEVIVVTAEKRSENVQRVPIAVSVLSSDDIRQLGISSSKDIVEHIPGLEEKNIGSTVAQWSIRGVTTGFDSDTQPANIGVYVNEVPLVELVQGTEIFDISDVEVLRGPQGTL